MPTLQLLNPNGGTWSASGNLSAAKSAIAGAGTQSAAMCIGGVGANGTTMLSATENFNGTAWSSSVSVPVAITRAGAAGTQNAILLFGGFRTTDSNPTAQVVRFNGTAWSVDSVGMNYLRNTPNGVGNQSAALVVGGYTGTMFLRDAEKFNGSTWSSAGTTNSDRYGSGAAGNTNAALTFGGGSNGHSTTAEKFNGSTWSTTGSLLTSKGEMAGAFASQDAALAVGGYDGNGSSATSQRFNGTAWSASASLGTARHSLASMGSSTAALTFGGYSSVTPGALAITEKFIGGGSPSPLSVAEGALANDTIATLSASEAGMAFTKVAGAGDTDNASFNISGSNLITLANLDYETKSSYSVRIQASNGSTTYQNVVTIDVSNVNEAPSNIEISLAQIQEGNAVNAIVGQLSAIDPDTGDTSFTFSISGGADAAKFNINGNNLRASEAFNYEAPADANADNIYAIQITAQDAGGLTYVKSFNISVTNNAADDSISAPSTAPMLGGKYRVDVNGNPKNTPVYVGGTENALPDGSVVRDTATSKKYVKLSGAATNYLEINDVPPVAWKWSEDGALSWDILQDM